MPSFRTLAGALAAALLSAPVVPLASPPLLGPELDTDPPVWSAHCPPATGYQYTAHAAANADGYLVVWSEGVWSPELEPGWTPGSSWNGTRDVYGVFVDASGAPRGQPFLIADGVGDQNVAGIASDGMSFLVLWSDYPTTASYYPSFSSYPGPSELRGVLLASDGTRMSDTLWLSAGMGSSSTASVAFDGASYGVAWATQFGDVHGTLVSPAGWVVMGPTPLQTDEAWSSNARLVAAVGGYYLAWESSPTSTMRSDTNPATLRVRRLDSWLQPASPSIDVVQSLPHGTYPAVATDGTSLLATWVEGAPPSSRSVRARIVSPDLSLGPAVTVTTRMDPTVSVVFDGAVYRLVWPDAADPSPNVYGADLGPDGQLLGPAYVVADSSAQERTPRLASNGAGGFLLTYRLASDVVRTARIQVRAGSPFVGGVSPYGPEAELTPAPPCGDFGPNSQRNPQVATDGSGYLLVWSDDRDSADLDVWGQHLSPAGDAITQPFPIHRGPGDQIVWGASWNGPGYLVLWEDHAAGPAAADVHGAIVGWNGELFRPAFPISAQPGAQTYPGAVPTPVGWRVVWRDARYGAANALFAAEVLFEGTVQPEQEIALSPGFVTSPHVATDGYSAYVYWSDTRGGDMDVYGAEITADGLVADPGGRLLVGGPYDQVHPRVGLSGSAGLLAYTNEDPVAGKFVRVHPLAAPLAPGPAAWSQGTGATGSQNAFATVTFDGLRFLVPFVTYWSGNADVSAVELLADGGSVTPRFLLASTPDTESFQRSASTQQGSVLFAVQRNEAPASRIYRRLVTSTAPATPLYRTVQMDATGDGTGTVLTGLVKTERSLPNTAQLLDGAFFTLEAKPGPDSVFVGWGGDCADRGADPVCVLHLTRDMQVTLEFRSLLPPPPPDPNPPYVRIRPLASVTARDRLMVTADASDVETSYGDVRVDFFVNGAHASTSWPVIVYQNPAKTITQAFATVPLAPGANEIVVQATDLSGATASDAVTVVYDPSFAAPAGTVLGSPVAIPVITDAIPNALTLARNDRRLFVSHPDGVFTFDVGAGGTLTYRSRTPTNGTPYKMATNVRGTALYVLTTVELAAYEVRSDGTLVQIQSIPAPPPYLYGPSGYGSQATPIVAGGALGEWLYVRTKWELEGYRIAPSGVLDVGGVVRRPMPDFGGFGYYATNLALADSTLFGSSCPGVSDQGGSVIALSFGPDGSLTGGEASAAIPPCRGAITADASGQNVYVGGWQTIAHVLRMSGGALHFDGTVSLLEDDGNSGWPLGMAVDPTGARLFAGLYTAHAFTVLDTDTLRPVPGSPVPCDAGTSTVGPLAVSSDGTLLFVLQGSGKQVGVYRLRAAAPLVASVSPPTGLSTGGTVVTVMGNGFGPDSTVSFGGTAAQSVAFTPDGALRVTTPAHAPGPADVVVQNVDGSVVRVEKGFTFYDDGANTPTGAGVAVVPTPTTASEPVAVATKLEFSSVSGGGETTVTVTDTAPPLPATYVTLGTPAAPARFIDITTTAQFAGKVQLAIQYDPAALGLTPEQERALRLLHYDCTSGPCAWVDVTEVANPHDPPYTDAEPRFFGRDDPAFENPDLQNHVIYGVATSFSPFAIVLERTLLSVTRVGSDTAIVESAPAGISCGTTCEAEFEGGTEVTLTVADPGDSVFLRWEGACTGTGACTVDLSSAQSVRAVFTTSSYPLTVVTSGSGGGSVTGAGLPACSAPAGCTASEPAGTVVLLTPSPDGTSRFAGWQGCQALSGTSCKVAMTQARTVTAIFEPGSYPLTVAAAGTGAGSFTGTSLPATCAAPAGCSATIAYGAAASVAVVPDPGFTATWAGCASVSGTTCTFTMSGPRTVTATFVPSTFPLTIATSGSGGGSVTGAGLPATCSAPAGCTADAPHNTVVTLTPAADATSRFAGWQGCQALSGTSCKVTMSEARTVTARFEPDSYALTVAAAGTGTGSFTGTSLPSTCAAPAGCSATIAHGTAGTVTALPAEGFTLAGWSGCTSVSGTTCSYTMSGARTVTATFSPGTFPLTVATSGSGGGSVAGGGLPATCSAPAGCTADEPYNAVVTLTPAADATSRFAGWQGCQALSGTSCKVTMSQARTVTARFEPGTHPLTVAAAGTGTGSFGGTSLPASCAAPAGCSATIAYGTAGSVTAFPAAGSTLAGWTGCTSVSGATCSYTMTGARTVTATFAPSTYPLTVVTAGSGGGSVAGAGLPATCSAPAGCTADEPYNAVVTLTPAPDATSRFTGWQGCQALSGTSCKVTMSQARTVTATFEPGS